MGPEASLGKGNFLGICISFLSSKCSAFQLHGGMGSHMQVLPTPSSTVNNTNTCILTTETILVLLASS